MGSKVADGSNRKADQEKLDRLICHSVRFFFTGLQDNGDLPIIIVDTLVRFKSYKITSPDLAKYLCIPYSPVQRALNVLYGQGFVSRERFIRHNFYSKKYVKPQGGDGTATPATPGAGASPATPNSAPATPGGGEQPKPQNYERNYIFTKKGEKLTNSRDQSEYFYYIDFTYTTNSLRYRNAKLHASQKSADSATRCLGCGAEFSAADSIVNPRCRRCGSELEDITLSRRSRAATINQFQALILETEKIVVPFTRRYRVKFIDNPVSFITLPDDVSRRAARVAKGGGGGEFADLDVQVAVLGLDDVEEDFGLKTGCEKADSVLTWSAKKTQQMEMKELPPWLKSMFALPPAGVDANFIERNYGRSVPEQHFTNEAGGAGGDVARSLVKRRRKWEVEESARKAEEAKRRRGERTEYLKAYVEEVSKAIRKFVILNNV